MKNLLFFSTVLLLFTGCSQKVIVTSFQPAKVDRASKTKNISILNFTNDNIGFASTLETKLAEKRVFGENYFTVITRDKLDTILKEQKLQYSGLVNKETAVKVGELLSAQAFVSGEVVDSSLSKNYYNELRLKCADKECKRFREYYVRCVKDTYNLTVSIKMSDIELGDIIFADSFNRNTSYSQCSDYGRSTLPSENLIISKFTASIVDEFVSDISPSKVNMSVELLDDPDIDYSDKEEKLLEHSLEYIKDNRLDKAEQLLSELLTSTNDKCYVAAYNLGVVKEAQGEFKKAKDLYSLADSLVLEPNEVINHAVLRIDNQLKNRDIVNSQVGK